MLCDCVFDAKLASEYNVKFLETSAKASINVEEAFITLSRDIKTKIDKKVVSPTSLQSSQVTFWSCCAALLIFNVISIVCLHNYTVLSPTLLLFYCF